MKPQTDLIAKLFRQEFARMVAVLGRAFGLEHIELAEDIVSDAFLKAAEAWPISGVPDNPKAWLYAVARNRALEHFRREKLFADKISPELEHEARKADPHEIGFSEDSIRDSQLRMLFAVCTPAIAGEAQIGLALRILCGFSIEEIAEAFLSNKEAINKRLFRAREKLRTANIRLDMPPAEALPARLASVHHILYLLFNEGYHSITHSQALRKDLCLEALRLALMLSEFPVTDTPATRALVALMCYHASRFEARHSADGSSILYEDQDRNLWDEALVAQGNRYLGTAFSWGDIGQYHLEAAIAYWHCQKLDTPEKWQAIVNLYNQLLAMRYSPVAALNRLYALYRLRGAETALAEALRLNLEGNHFYHTLLGELYGTLDRAKAKTEYERAIEVAKTEADRQTIRKKMERLG